MDSCHHLCQACWDLAVDMLLSVEATEETPTPRGHTHVCIHCGRSLRNARSHRLRSNPEREQRILNVISEWILPRTVSMIQITTLVNITHNYTSVICLSYNNIPILPV